MGKKEREGFEENSWKQELYRRLKFKLNGAATLGPAVRLLFTHQLHVSLCRVRVGAIKVEYHDDQQQHNKHNDDDQQCNRSCMSRLCGTQSSMSKAAAVIIITTTVTIATTTLVVVMVAVTTGTVVCLYPTEAECEEEEKSYLHISQDCYFFLTLFFIGQGKTLLSGI